MKKLILALTVAALAVGAQAGEGCGGAEKSGCEGKEKAPASCPASKESAKDAASCPATGQAAKKDSEKKPAEAQKADQAKKS